MKIVIAYVPVLHRGYVDFFTRHANAETLYVLGKGLCETYAPYLTKEIRAMTPEESCLALRGLNIHQDIRVLTYQELQNVADLSSETVLVYPNDDVGRYMANSTLPGKEVIFDNVFLRWDRDNARVNQPVNADREEPFHFVTARFLEQAKEASKRATNWWRQVGAVLVRDGESPIVAWNQHVPSLYLPYAEGDPRNCFKRGVHIDLSTDEHAEARIIADAAREGRSLAGADLYITTFPCPPCAKLVGRAGIKRLFFLEGYAMLDGERVLRHYGVELIHVVQNNPSPR